MIQETGRFCQFTNIPLSDAAGDPVASTKNNHSPIKQAAPFPTHTELSYSSWNADGGLETPGTSDKAGNRVPKASKYFKEILYWLVLSNVSGGSQDDTMAWGQGKC